MSRAELPGAAGRPGLVRSIGRLELIAFGINFIVGASIFGLPSKVFALSGPASLIAFVMCAAATAMIACCFAEVSSRYAQTGGPYLFARETFGPLVGFEVGWLRWLSGATSFAANVNLLATYVGYFREEASAGAGRVLVVAGVTALLTAINVIGVRRAALASDLFAAGKLLPLLGFVLVGVFFVDPANFVIEVVPDHAAMATSVLLVAYAFSGFESITIPAGELRDARRTAPFALFATLTIVTVFYLAVHAVCIGTLPDLATSERPLADASERFLGPAGGYLIAACALVSIVGNLNGQLLVTPRVMYAMAEHGQLPGPLAAVHAHFRTPHVSILLSAAVILALALTGTFIGLLTISVLARLFVYSVTCASLSVLRRRPDAPPAAFRAPAGDLLAVASIGICLWLLTSSTTKEAVTTAIAAGIGVLIYATQARRRVPLARPATDADEVD